jgi:hypothetical protein
MSFPSLRRRVPNEASISPASGTLVPRALPATNPPTVQIQSGALSRIMAGVFGTRPNPSANLSAEVTPFPGKQGFYSYHEGDLFTPGAQNYVFDYPLEFPMQTIWGHGFLRRPNTFKPLQPAQSYSNPNVVTNGLGGLVAGQWAFQAIEQNNG